MPQTYVQWLRASASTLTGHDRKAFEEEQQWLLDNPKKAKVLAACIGKRMQLKADRECLDEDERYRAGTVFQITDHWGPRLHGFPNDGRDTVIVALRLEWLEPAVEEKSRKALRRRNRQRNIQSVRKQRRAQGAEASSPSGSEACSGLGSDADGLGACFPVLPTMPATLKQSFA